MMDHTSARPSNGYYFLALSSAVILILTAAIESCVGNSSRLSPSDWAESLADSLPPVMRWARPSGDWAHWVFAYPTCFLLASAVIGTLIALERRTAHVIANTNKTKRNSPVDREIGANERQLAPIQRTRDRIIDPAIGAVFISVLCWLIAAVIAAKIDVPWTRAFLPPPMLVAQNLQIYGGRFFLATIRSGTHMLQAVVIGTALGISLGFLLARLRWLQRWTAWHFTIVAALPPFVLAEVFRQIVRPKWFPVFGSGEIAFKLGIAMASWAVMWPVLTATAHVLANIDDEYRRSIRLLGARTTSERLWHIDAPFVAPPVLANLRVGFVIGLIVLIYGESYGSPPGSCLGFWFSETTNNYKLQTLVALVVFMSLLVVIFEASLRAIETFLVFTRGRVSVSSPTEFIRSSIAEERRNCLERYEMARDKFVARYGSWKSVDWTKESGDALVRIRGIRKSYGGDPVFAGPMMEKSWSTGQFVSIIGKSGAGKSTFLKLLLGFEEADRGNGDILCVGGFDLSDPESFGTSTAKLIDRVAYVAQRPLLMPHKTVEANLCFGIVKQWEHCSGLSGPLGEYYRNYLRWVLTPILLEPHAELREWIWPANASEVLASTFDSPLGLLIRFMGLSDKMQSYPAELSGGEAQRVHLLRWIVLGRPLLVMDEAFSALDQPLKGMVRDAIRRNAQAFGTSVINVSHDRSDVLQVSDTVLFIDDRQIRADTSPTNLYFAPKTRELAVFLGHTNIFRIQPLDRPSREVRLREDQYRSVQFVVDQPVITFDGDIVPGVTEVFIPRSDVNVDQITNELSDTTRTDWYSIEDLRFTGTHYDIRLVRRTADGLALKLDSVVQDDELTELLRPSGLSPSNVCGHYAKVSIARGIDLSARGARL